MAADALNRITEKKEENEDIEIENTQIPKSSEQSSLVDSQDSTNVKSEIDSMKHNLKKLSSQTNKLSLLENQLSQVSTELKQQLNPLDTDKQMDTYQSKIEEIHAFMVSQQNKDQANHQQIQDCFFSLRQKINGLGDFEKLYELSKGSALDIRRILVMVKQESLDKHLTVIRLHHMMKELETFICQSIKNEYNIRREVTSLKKECTKKQQQIVQMK